MAEYTYIPIQTVEDGASVLFNAESVRGSPAVYHRDGSGIITLRGNTTQCRARYKITFGGNIAVPTGETVGPISIALAIVGEPQGSATAIITPAAVEQYGNVFVAAFVDVFCGCCVSLGVRNISGIPINVQNANLIVERVA